MQAGTAFVLKEEQIEEFYREGYFYAPGFISRETVDAINAEHQPFVQARNQTEWKSLGFKAELNKYSHLPATRQFLTDPGIVGIFERILGGKTRFWLGMYAVVPPFGNGLAWHQDNQYTHILGHMLNGFIALDEITQDNAGLWLAPRTHRLGRQPNLNDEQDGHKRAAEPDNAIPCRPLSPGDAVIFHRELLHHSKENRTGLPRRAYAFQVAAANCRYAESGKNLDGDLL